MTLTSKLPGRQHRFYFYETGPGVSDVVQSINPGRDFTLEDVRIALSISHASVADVACRLSSVLGSAYNVTFFSYAIQGYSNYFWQPSQTLYCLSGDQIIISLPILSAANVWGFYVSGWAVVEPSNRG